MGNLLEIKQKTTTNGFAILQNVFSEQQVIRITQIIQNSETTHETFRKNASLFAIRQLLKEVPGIKPYIFTEALNQIITSVFGEGYFVCKSIYFDKPALSNWFVAYHQDLTISVAEKYETEGFTNWTVKQNQYAVQPPAELLQDNFTLRIHLDDTDEHNGVLKVIQGSHTRGVIPPKEIVTMGASEITCPVKKGGVMVMKPLLLHASGRTVNAMRRRVIHIEFSKSVLPAPLQWAEK